MRGQNPIRVGCEKETCADLLQLARCSENIYIKMRANCVISIYSLVYVYLRPVIKSSPNLSSWIYIIGRNFTPQIWGLNPGGGLVFESLRRFSTNKNRCFFYPRVYSISVYKMDSPFESNGIGDLVYQTVVVSKYFELTMGH